MLFDHDCCPFSFSFHSAITVLNAVIFESRRVVTAAVSSSSSYDDDDDDDDDDDYDDDLLKLFKKR